MGYVLLYYLYNLGILMEKRAMERLTLDHNKWGI
jgi:hypothetical protein